MLRRMQQLDDRREKLEIIIHGASSHIGPIISVVWIMFGACINEWERDGYEQQQKKQNVTHVRFFGKPI